MGAIEAKILFLGLDNSGKSSVISYFESRGEVHTSEEPTVGFKEKNIKYKSVNFRIWDVAGKENVRGLWKHYYSDKDAVVFVLDASNADRLEQGINQLKLVLGEGELKDSVLLVLANKQDLPDAVDAEAIRVKLQPFVGEKRVWKVFNSTTKVPGGELVQQAFWWLSKALKERKKETEKAEKEKKKKEKDHH
eukprot:TRINITY_DN538_c0_g1_i1.p1 TRINITY_DN538_c0_g1~~TRINITY_DN538_c0_g1_i1.p1  ORF type:complete len:192 (-),score=57.82 TRINITY_DN538_c0_g1_i1:91-666(-)